MTIADLQPGGAGSHRYWTLAELVTKKQSEEILAILNSSDDSIERTRKLSAYLNTLREQLEKKGVVPEYLAYFLEFSFGSGTGS